jgi:glycine/D-amino acid oxidase-like deaminating enzyme
MDCIAVCKALYYSSTSHVLLPLLLLITLQLPLSGTLPQADPKRVAAASASFSSMTSLGDSPPDTVQACMRPCPPDSLPIMGAVEGITGAYIAAGHNCWVCTSVYTLQ